MNADIDCDVLIVGAGPTGVTLGLLLAREGVRTVVIDKEAGIYPLPRAAHIDHEAVRIFQMLGLADDVMRTSRSSPRYDFLNADREVLLRFDGADRLGPGGWPAGNMIHQPSLEALLRKAADGQSGFDLKERWSFLSFDQRDDMVFTEVETPSGRARVRSRFIVGADGARSPVRVAAAIEMDDLQFDEPWLVIDAIVDDFSRLPEVNLQICDPARPTTCVLMGEGRHRWEFMVRPGETTEQVLNDTFIAALLAPWNVDGAIRIERKVVYRFNARIARQWRKSLVLLAGDAAHQMPPFAGQGLCSGLRDAATLAWKLGAVLRGASASLLDDYQIEREPNVRGIIAMAIMMGRTVCITDPEAAAARDAQMLAARAAGASPDGAPRYPAIERGCILEGSPGSGAYFPQPVSTARDLRLDDVLGEGAWLISRTPVTEPVAGPSPLRVVGVDDDLLAPFREELTAWLSAHNADAVVVRPDRYVFGAGDPRTLNDAWRARTF